MEHPGPYVVIGSNAYGRTVEVGLFDNERDLRLHVSRNTRDGCRYSVWTPRMNDTISAASVIGISMARTER